MDAIKKKMQAMKLEKDNAADKADAMEGQAKDANARVEKLNEEVRIFLTHPNNESRKLYFFLFSSANSKRNCLKLKVIWLAPRTIWNNPTRTSKKKTKILLL